jgi:hypothetical protein
MNMTKSSVRFRLTIAFIVLMGIMLSGCVIAHPIPLLFFRFTVQPPAGARLRVKFFLEHKETNPSTGITSFVPKGEREVRMPSGSPSVFTWDAVVRERYQGGIWQGRVRVWVQSGAQEIYVGEATQEMTLPYDAPSTGTIRPFTFGLTPVPTGENPSGFRITAIA